MNRMLQLQETFNNTGLQRNLGKHKNRCANLIFGVLISDMKSIFSF